MVATLAHRGPDGSGVWVDEEGGSALALGHRRLSIVDLSEHGRQPMLSPSSGRFVITYNGEIYNHRELRAELEAAGIRFRSTSDTEVILAAIERWGVAQALPRLNGMFAFALWDRATRTLTLARDRLGIKPLYYGRSGAGTFLFASELKAMHAWPGFDGAIDPDAVASYLRYGYVPAPCSIYRGVRKLPPGSFLTLADMDAVHGGAGRLARFWSAEEVIERRVLRTATPLDESADELEDLLTDAVRRQMVADVPVGAFLSGGIDSSTVVAVMQSVSTCPVRTYSIGFETPAWIDEARHAREIAQHLGTDHAELYVTDRDVREVAALLPRLYDEPLGDPSQLPTYLVSRLAREGVKVALSGDGGDELFFGYDRYRFAPRAWRKVAMLPGPMRKGLARTLPGSWLDGLLDRASAAVPGVPNAQTFENAKALLRVAGVEDLYDWSVGAWLDADRLIVPDAGRRAPGLPRTLFESVAGELCEQLGFADLVCYLPDDILTKVDRASMAVGLEVRVPLLDHRIAEYAWSLPAGAKLREDGRGKEILRRVLHRYVPERLVERPKSGFVGPLGAWLRGPLRAWADELFLSGAGGRAEWLNHAEARRLWSNYLDGRERSPDKVWRTAVLLAWLRDGDGKTSAKPAEAAPQEAAATSA